MIRCGRRCKMRALTRRKRSETCLMKKVFDRVARKTKSNMTGRYDRTDFEGRKKSREVVKMKKQKLIFGISLGAVALLLIPVALILAGIITLPGNRLNVSKVTDPVGLYLEGFTQEGNAFSLKVGNSTEIFDFTPVIAVADGAEYAISGSTEETVMQNGVASLSAGDNTFYIGVRNGEEQAVYDVCIRRLPIYTVSFNTRGGSELPPIEAEEGCAFTPEIPELIGHDFSCWLIGNEIFDASQGVFDNVTLTAQWIPKVYKITYVTEIGQLIVSETTVTYNSLFIPDLPPENEYYEFCGWYYGEEPMNETIWKLTEDVTLTAKWKSKALIVEEGVVTGLTDLGRTLDEIVVPAENGTEAVRAIGDKVFAYNTLLKKITLPSLERIGEQAFFGCGNLGEVVCEGQLLGAGREAFAKTAWLESQPDGGVYLGNCLLVLKGDDPGVFTVREGTLAIADYAFDGKSITGAVFDPELLYVGAHAFEDCSFLFSVSVNDALLYIGDFAFYGCDSLIPPSLLPTVSLGKNVFPSL